MAFRRSGVRTPSAPPAFARSAAEADRQARIRFQPVPSVDKTSDQLEDSSGRGLLSWILWLPLAVLIYFLSVGPAIWVYEHTKNPGARKSIETFYAPLEWAARKPVVGRVIEAYARCWHGLGKQ